MNIARMIVLGIAVVTAGLAAYMVRSMSTSQGPAVAAYEQPATIPTQGVLVSTRNINVGETVNDSDFRWQQWPEDAVHNSFIVGKDGTSFSQYSGSVMRTPVVEGEPLTNQKMVKIGEGGVMAAIIEPGKRGIGIEISAETGAGGFILPNDRVDVIMTRKYKEEGNRNDIYSSETILSNVRVLAIDQTFREEDGQQVVVGRTATLELSSGQSEDLALAAQMGEVSLALRSLASLAGGAGTDAQSSARGSGDRRVAVLRNARKSTR